jgi:simple sugar transport system ATP-binding protein/D-xylose transport system ATP-binding protein
MAAENGASLPLVDVVGVSKSFGHVEALRSVSFSIHESEVVALLGDNGAGKSTLVKVLAGVHRPDEGDIVKGGHPLQLRDATDALRAGIATVYQDLAVVDTLDVARNVYLGAIPRRFGVLIDYPKMYRDARQVLTALRVDLPSVHTRVRELSGGQRQAVAIARALAVEASLFLMDEPTAALGVAQTAKVNELLADLKAAGKSVMVITHNLEHVFQIADRVVVLRHGKCVAVRRIDDTSREEVVGLITGAVVGDATVDAA